mgnify:CR=1 FL=1
MFQKKPAPTARPSADTMSGATFSVLGADIVIKGDVSATADLHIDGRIEGDIACAALVQGEKSEIIGAITAQSARLAGIVRGSITAGDLVITKTAHIHGDVHYNTLSVEQGAQVDGRFAQRGSAAPVIEGESRLLLAK